MLMGRRPLHPCSQLHPCSPLHPPRATGRTTPPQPTAPPIEPEERTRRTKPEEWDAALPAALDTSAFRRKLAEWLAYRRKVRRKPVSDAALPGMLAKLAAVGSQRAIATIDLSISNDWTGLFPDKTERSLPGSAGLDDSRRMRYAAVGGSSE